jgi:hypothetical protein
LRWQRRQLIWKSKSFRRRSPKSLITVLPMHVWGTVKTIRVKRFVPVSFRDNHGHPESRWTNR